MERADVGPLPNQIVKLLRDIATIRAGVTFRERVEITSSGEYALIQIKDVDRDRGVNVESLGRIDVKSVGRDQLLRPGDVLFVARGARNYAVVFPGNVGDAIAGSQFFVIRPNGGVLPEYLAWYLNEEVAQRHFSEYVSGSLVQFIPKAGLESLEVLLPPLPDQPKIVEVHRLMLKEQDILEAIKGKRRFAVETALRRSLELTRRVDHIVKDLR